jgi:SAM-dependent methyltransferase
MHDAPLRPSAALIAYAEPFIAGRRVLVFGDATSAIAEQLLDRGARLVHMYDPDPARVAEAATRNTESRVSLAPLSEGGLASREGAFDCALVEDLTSLPNRTSALRALRRALSPRGIALIAAPNPDAERRLIGAARPGGDLDYYALYDAVAAELDHVRMLGQTPFVGYAIVDFAPDGTPEPSFDSSFLPGGAEEPEQYIALASAQEARLEEMTIVQLPLARVAGAGGDDHALRAARSAERRAQKRIASLEAELRRLRQSGDDLQRLQNELDRRDSWIRELENRAATADARADDAETELESMRERVVALTTRISELEASQRANGERRARAQEDGAQLQALRDELDELKRVAARTQREREWAEERVRKLEDELESVLREVEEGADAPSAPEAAPAPELARELEDELLRTREALETSRQAAERLRGELEAVRADQKARAAGVVELEARLAQAEAARAQAEAAKKDLESGRRELERERAQLQAQLAQRDEEQAQLAERAAEELRGDLQRDLKALEGQLVERGRHVQELEEQLRKLERYGRTLVAELTELRSGGAASEELQQRATDLERRLEELAELNAAREADLVAAEWVIAELRDKLAAGVPPLVALHRAGGPGGSN